MLFAVTLSLSLGLCRSSAAAQDPEPVPLRKGEPAPYDGQLLTPQRAATLVVKIEQAAQHHELEVKRLTRLHEQELQLVEERHASRAASAEQRAELYAQALEAASVWYRSEAFWFAMGTLAALVVTGVVGATFSALARAGAYIPAGAM